MASIAQITANTANAQSSTGPRTDAGKSTSSSNAVKLGLFCKRDFVRPEDEAEHAQLRAELLKDLSPEGALEETLAAEIVTASWRLRRCATVEAGLIERCFTDPMEDEAVSRIQTAVDRARAGAHNILRRSLADLRRIQTDRAIQREVTTGEAVGVVRYQDVVTAMNKNEVLKKRIAASAEAQLFAGLDTPLSHFPAAA